MSSLPSPILLLGASGLLGHHLLRHFPHAATPSHAEADLADPASLKRALQKYRPALILNAAAYTAVDKAESEPGQAMRLNAEAPAQMAAYCHQTDARLLHFSTDYVFDGSGDAPWRESASTAPINAYGTSKAQGEAAILASECNHLIIRTSWLYDATRPSFFNSMLHLAAEREQLSVVNDSVGSPTYAPHLVDAVAQLAARPDIRGFLHLANKGFVTWYAFAQAIFQAAHQREMLRRIPQVNAVTMAQYPSAAQRPANCRLDTHRAASLGLELPSWQEGLARALAQRAAENNAA